MSTRLPISIAARITLGLLVVGTVAVGGAASTYIAMDAQANRVAALTRAADGPALVERLRAEIYAIVMESRGLYIARDTAQATTFADNLRGHLSKVKADWKLLHDVLPLEEQASSAELDSAMDRFVALRTELARIGVEEGSGAADKLGNNDANRSARTAFSNGLDKLAETTTRTVKRLETETIATGGRVALTVLTLTVLAVAITLGLIPWLIRSSVSAPLRRLAGAIGDMAEGKLDNVILPPDSGDEVGEISAAAKVFLDKLVRNRELEAAAAAQRAKRDRQAAAMNQLTLDFSQSISGAMASLGTSTESMRRAANDMSHAVEQTHEGAGRTAAGAEESARSLAGVAAATEELSASVNEIARSVTQATEAARDAVGRATTSNATMRGLSEATGQISDITRLIADITAQTNLLALNATIEAARAGDAGKGFAVVASEVKQLAQQTAQATTQIGIQIGAIQTATADAVDAMQGVGEAITRVDEIASAIAAAITQQDAATREIAVSVQSVARQNDDATQSMRQVSDVAEGASASSRSVLATAEDVTRVSGTLFAEIGQFIAAASSNVSENRHYERISGNNARVTLRPRGAAAVSAGLMDVSCGGAALACSLKLDSGSEVEIGLPGLDGVVPARVVRSTGEIMAIVFRQDPLVLARVDDAMMSIGRGIQPVQTAAAA